MATSPETLSQVRNILRKLDQSIDQARGKRLSGPETANSGPPPAPVPMPAQTLIGAPANPAPQNPAANNALRARPLATRRDGPSILPNTQAPRAAG